MSSQLRKLLASKFLPVVKSGDVNRINDIARAFELKSVKSQPELHLKTKSLTTICDVSPSKEAIAEVFRSSMENGPISQTNVIANPKGDSLAFTIHNDHFVKEALSNASQTLIDEPKQKILVEFSSPNIAKPFHVGHLRSTILGNFISNIYKAFGHDVVRINYLGDWGTQFGLLKIGMDASGLTEDEVRTDPIRHLFEAYVNANKLAAEDPTITAKARDVFCQLENGEQADLNEWNSYRKYTVTELQSVYERLGIEFDEYSWESQYAKQKIPECLKLLTKQNVMVEQEDGSHTVQIDDKAEHLLKSDGTTLYLTRDVAAIMDRQRRHQFDRMLYVVENGQHSHFHALFEIARRLNIPNCEGLQHVKFGRINKMSTRKGNVVFLKDILDEARTLTMENQINSPTTKIDLETIQSHAAEALGCSSVIINDLKRKRMANYDFDWEKILMVKGDTGTALHCTHSRLCSLKEITGINEAEICQPKLLAEPEAKALIFEIVRFAEVLQRSKCNLESGYFSTYCFGLCNAISKALKCLNIKNEPSSELQEQRMLLFMTARRTLAGSMRILGLKPLDKM